MLAFYPHPGAEDMVAERITWHGGTSTMLHYEVQVDDWKGDPDWIEREVRTLSCLPTGMKEMYQEMSQFYDDIITMHYERRMAMAD